MASSINTDVDKRSIQAANSVYTVPSALAQLGSGPLPTPAHNASHPTREENNPNTPQQPFYSLKFVSTNSKYHGSLGTRRARGLQHNHLHLALQVRRQHQLINSTSMCKASIFTLLGDERKRRYFNV